jgi:hypothetical protein
MLFINQGECFKVLVPRQWWREEKSKRQTALQSLLKLCYTHSTFSTQRCSGHQISDGLPAANSSVVNSISLPDKNIRKSLCPSSFRLHSLAACGRQTRASKRFWGELKEVGPPAGLLWAHWAASPQSPALRLCHVHTVSLYMPCIASVSACLFGNFVSKLSMLCFRFMSIFVATLA